MTRWVFTLVVTVLVAMAAPARAQTALVLQANPVPIVEAQINGRPARLEVDLRAPNALFLSQAQAQRLGLFIMPLAKVAVAIDGGTSLRGRLARPRLVFGNAEARALTGVFPTSVTPRADGMIGPGVLPFDVVTVALGPDAPGAHDVVLPLASADRWAVSTNVGGQPVSATFNVAGDESVFNRTAAERLGATGAIVSEGAAVDRVVIVGLSTSVQPVRTSLAALGLALTPAVARTEAPLRGADDPDAIVVASRSQHPLAPGLTIGRAALAHCVSITVNRVARQMTLRCAG